MPDDTLSHAATHSCSSVHTPLACRMSHIWVYARRWPATGLITGPLLRFFVCMSEYPYLYHNSHHGGWPDTYMPVQVLQCMTRCLQWYPVKPEIELVRQTCGAVGHCKSGSMMGLPRTYANLTINLSTSRYTLLPQPTIACLLDWNVDASSTPDHHATIVQRGAS
jgi:hypothetical protein